MYYYCLLVVFFDQILAEFLSLEEIRSFADLERLFDGLTLMNEMEEQFLDLSEEHIDILSKGTSHISLERKCIR